MKRSYMVTQWRLAAFAVVFALSSWAVGAVSPVKDVATDDVIALQSTGTVLIDVRRADEWRSTGVIDGSYLITAYDASGNLNPNFVDAVTRLAALDQPVALICRSGRRSTAAARLLTENVGFSAVYNVDGGMVAWTRTGKPVEPCPSC